MNNCSHWLHEGCLSVSGPPVRAARAAFDRVYFHSNGCRPPAHAQCAASRSPRPDHRHLAAARPASVRCRSTSNRDGGEIHRPPCLLHKHKYPHPPPPPCAPPVYRPLADTPYLRTQMTARAPTAKKAMGTLPTREARIEPTSRRGGPTIPSFTVHTTYTHIASLYLSPT